MESSPQQFEQQKKQSADQQSHQQPQQSQEQQKQQSHQQQPQQQPQQQQQQQQQSQQQSQEQPKQQTPQKQPTQEQQQVQPPVQQQTDSVSGITSKEKSTQEGTKEQNIVRDNNKFFNSKLLVNSKNMGLRFVNTTKQNIKEELSLEEISKLQRRRKVSTSISQQSTKMTTNFIDNKFKKFILKINQIIDNESKKKKLRNLITKLKNFYEEEHQKEFFLTQLIRKSYDSKFEDTLYLALTMLKLLQEGICDKTIFLRAFNKVVNQARGDVLKYYPYMMQSLGFFITLAKSHNLLSYNCITLQISKESKEDTLKISNIFNLSCSCLQCINIYTQSQDQILLMKKAWKDEWSQFFCEQLINQLSTSKTSYEDITNDIINEIETQSQEFFQTSAYQLYQPTINKVLQIL